MGHRGEIAHHVVGHLAVERTIDGVSAHRAHHQMMSIGWRLGHGVGADIAPGSGLVVDHHSLPELSLLREQAGQDVRRATGREGHHQPDRLVGKALGYN